jgi:hypothetical protein
VTLVEMLVTVAVLVLIMTVLVQIFQAATGAVSAAQTLQELDNQLRLLDATIRSDLSGVTARFTPPLDPAQNLGYFEYGENEFADTQGEDSDDYIRFTAKAPPNQPFTGRVWLISPDPNMNNLATQPVTVTSEYAEIIYFLRSGNLYRRVLLVAPQLQSSIAQGAGATYTPVYLGVPVSWQGVNDLSARPAKTGNSGSPIVLNTLGDLTNRENRFASPRFADDFSDVTGAVAAPDGFYDDLNGDKVPDYYPTLYPGLFAAAAGGTGPPMSVGGQLAFEPPFPPNNAPGFRGLLGFPWIFPGAYSQAQKLTTATQVAGWIHAPAPVANVPQGNGSGAEVSFDSAVAGLPNPTGALFYLQSMNHNPLDIRDNLPTAFNPALAVGVGTDLNQTWWGFPTWRETLSPLWNDPTIQVNLVVPPNAVQAQPNGLAPLTAGQVSNGNCVFLADGKTQNPFLLPAMTSIWRNNSQLFTDGAGDFAANGVNFFFTAAQPLWGALSWEDDLIMTNVRSFDVKAYDDSLATYADLGWGDDFRLPQQSNDVNATFLQAPYLTGNYDEFTQNYVAPAFKVVNLQFRDLLTQTFAHEGRMPPLIADNRFDAQFGAVAAGTYGGNGANYTGNVGDDNTIVRLRRVWDTWSTDYSRAPATGPAAANFGFPVGPPFTPPIYPSYPPPYPAPLRGIQIQIRVTDPANQRIKSVTIRQDFTDKL